MRGNLNHLELDMCRNYIKFDFTKLKYFADCLSQLASLQHLKLNLSWNILEDRLEGIKYLIDSIVKLSNTLEFLYLDLLYI